MRVILDAAVTRLDCLRGNARRCPARRVLKSSDSVPQTLQARAAASPTRNWRALADRLCSGRRAAALKVSVSAISSGSRSSRRAKRSACGSTHARTALGGHPSGHRKEWNGRQGLSLQTDSRSDRAAVMAPSGPDERRAIAFLQAAVTDSALSTVAASSTSESCGLRECAQGDRAEARTHRAESSGARRRSRCRCLRPGCPSKRRLGRDKCERTSGDSRPPPGHPAAPCGNVCIRLPAHLRPRRVREHSGAQPETLTHRALPSCQSRETRLIRARGANCDQSSWKRDLLHGSLTVDCGYQCPRRASPCSWPVRRSSPCLYGNADQAFRRRSPTCRWSPTEPGAGRSTIGSSRQSTVAGRPSAIDPRLCARPTGGRADAHHRRSHARAARSGL